MTHTADNTDAAHWTVYTQWRAIFEGGRSDETCQTYPTWAAARYAGLHLCCLSGVRYVTVLSPEHIVAADYDRLTNYWREYAPKPAPSGSVGGTTTSSEEQAHG